MTLVENDIDPLALERQVCFALAVTNRAVLARRAHPSQRRGGARQQKGFPMNRPSPLQYIGYSFGRRLPEDLNEWVRNDLAGVGAVRRTVVRAAIPPLLVLAPFWLLPASLYVHLEMTAPIYIWALLMSLALNKVWRRYRLAQHNLDPNLVDEINRAKNARMHEAYVQRYGPRPEEAQWQSNSSPF